MTWFISVALAAVFCGIALAIGRAMRREAEPGSPEADRGLIVIVLATVVFVLWAGVHTALSSLEEIEAGHVAVVYEFGEIVGQKGEGLQFIAPWQIVREQSIRVQRHRFDNISGFSQETQDVIVSATVNYRVDPAAVQQLYRTVGPNWFDTLVEPRINQFFKAETVKYNTVDIAPNREQIRRDVQSKLDEDLRRFSITVEDLLIDNIDFTQDFKESIEAKQIATQDRLRAVEEAERKREQERGTADAERIRAAGEADAIRIRAEAQAEANGVIDGSLSQPVLQFLAIQKLASNLEIALLPSSTGIIIDPATLLSGPSSLPPPSDGEE